MDDLIRLFIENDRIIKNKNNNLKLTNNEARYINKVMRIKIGKEIFITNGKGSLWKAINLENNFIKINNISNPYLFKEKEKTLLGIAVVIPKNGFEDILKMCTEIGIDFIQPLYSDRQVKKYSNFSNKLIRWDSIINEAVEQCERLWRPSILNHNSVFDWINSRGNEDIISVSVTRDDSSENLYYWLKKRQNLLAKKGGVLWNVIGPEGGWSKGEIEFFIKNKISFVKLSETILRTSTATVNATSILNQWRNDLN
ncbi:16S rRNA (uracil(1498)-N(3))-methyltransferase [Prochlorococcus sp. AH-716-K03]|nr:16S rRNA (uracil(1498)-N(3))-methyltransferase [Prochlorococcus sp. AH-716-K03]